LMIWVPHSETVGHQNIPFSNSADAKRKASPGPRCSLWPPPRARTRTTLLCLADQEARKMRRISTSSVGGWFWMKKHCLGPIYGFG
jgi:hypothetical protein